LDVGAFPTLFPAGKSYFEFLNSKVGDPTHKEVVRELFGLIDSALSGPWERHWKFISTGAKDQLECPCCGKHIPKFDPS
jgi:hypothetical protein